MAGRTAKTGGKEPRISFHRFEELCHKVLGQISAVADTPFLDRAREMIVPPPEPVSMDFAAAMAWIEKAAPRALPREIAMARGASAKPYGRFDLFAKLSELNIPAEPNAGADASRRSRWRRWHAEASSPVRGLAA